MSRSFPGDTIIVRKADIIYVVGDVARPSGVLMEGGRPDGIAGGCSGGRHKSKR